VPAWISLIPLGTARALITTHSAGYAGIKNRKGSHKYNDWYVAFVLIPKLLLFNRLQYTMSENDEKVSKYASNCIKSKPNYSSAPFHEIDPRVLSILS
jgi:hypothetical protein